MSTRETPVVLGEAGERMYGFLTVPADVPSFPAVLLLDGMGGSSHGPRRMFATLARRLALQGVGVLRFGYRGHGDSEGDSRDVTVIRMRDDAAGALAFLRRQPGVDASRVGLVGMSLGGLVAALVAGAEPDLRAVVLWAGVAHNGSRTDAWLTPERAEQLRVQGYYDNGGTPMSLAFFEELRDLDGPAAIVRYPGPALVLHGTADASVPVEDGHRYKEVLGDRADLVLLDGADHVFGKLAWEDEVLDRTSRFLSAALAATGDPARARS
jgi:hypothetical protein